MRLRPTALSVLAFPLIFATEAAATPRKKEPPKAEVEINATIKPMAGAARYVLFVADVACESAEGDHIIGTTRVERPGYAFIEIFVAQRAKVFICGGALDAQDNLIGLAAAAASPVLCQGKGEVTFSGIELAPVALDKPRPFHAASNSQSAE